LGTEGRNGGTRLVAVRLTPRPEAASKSAETHLEVMLNKGMR